MNEVVLIIILSMTATKYRWEDVNLYVRKGNRCSIGIRQKYNVTYTLDTMMDTKY